MNLVYSDAEELVQPMECDEDNADDISILLKQVSGKSEEVENVMNNDDTSHTNTNSQSLVMPEESKTIPNQEKKRVMGHKWAVRMKQELTESDQNAKPMVREEKGKLFVYFIATYDILPDNKILYDYCDSSDVSKKFFPWLRD